MMTQGRGFSLVELMVAVALAAVLFGLALPSLHDWLQRNRVSASANLLLTHIQFARLRAVMDGSDIVICPSLDGASCVNDSRAWSHGWIVFQDRDFQQPPQLGPADQLLLAHANPPEDAQVHATPAFIRYSPTGSATNRTLTVCGPAGSAHARAVIVNIAGRARVSATAPGGISLDCPKTL